MGVPRWLQNSWELHSLAPSLHWSCSQTTQQSTWKFSWVFVRVCLSERVWMCKHLSVCAGARRGVGGCLGSTGGAAATDAAQLVPSLSVPGWAACPDTGSHTWGAAVMPGRGLSPPQPLAPLELWAGQSDRGGCGGSAAAGAQGLESLESGMSAQPSSCITVLLLDSSRPSPIPSGWYET